VVPPIPYDVIAGEEDLGEFRGLVLAQFPTLPLDDPILNEYWPVFDATYRNAISQQAGHTEREQFTVGFGLGVVAAAVIGYVIFLAPKKDPEPSGFTDSF